MKTKKKIFIKRILNLDNYNELDIQKSEDFINNLQELVVDNGLVKINKGEYEIDGISYDMKTYYSLFCEDPKDEFKMKKIKINEFPEGKIIRYFNKQIELLIIILEKRIKLIFYCDNKNRDKIMDSLLKFCQVKKVKS